ncbi:MULTISPECIES: hypothetical protein [unclassified Microcoleus]|uniref:hypothetical protein n=1 Tax=unclassified Microcoleus TaxID=2642155 RepID=UPI002FD12827
MDEMEGLRQRELCDRLMLDYREMAATAKQLGLSTHAYIQQKTGWILFEELYYPPETIVVTEDLCCIPLILYSKSKR